MAKPPHIYRLTVVIDGNSAVMEFPSFHARTVAALDYLAEKCAVEYANGWEAPKGQTPMVKMISKETGKDI